MITQNILRVLVVDDTRLYRKLLSDILLAMEGVQVVGMAENGQTALDKIAQLRPDLVTLDVEMPTMDGLETLRQLRGAMPLRGAMSLRGAMPQMAVVMVSAHTVYGAKITMQALELGAVDFITKPENGDLSDNVAHIRNQLRPIINTWRTKKSLPALGPGDGGHASPRAPTSETRVPDVNLRRTPVSPRIVMSPAGSVDIIALGVSTGGPQALTQLIPHLPPDLRVPMVIVQHMPPMFTAALATALNDKSALKVVEGGPGQLLEAGTVYIAPGGKQMKVVRRTPEHPCSLLITDDPPENYCKPSVDYLFRSVAQVYAGRALGVIMTGMGADGVLGLRLMKRQGARVIAQDEASCVVFGMPMEAIKAGVVDAIVPLEQLASAIRKYVCGR